MNIYAIDLNLSGTVYVKALSEDEANKKLADICPVAADVHDPRWFSSVDDIYLADGFTLGPPVNGQRPHPVSDLAMRTVMRPSIRGEKRFWLRSSRYDYRQEQELVTYESDIACIATGFISAASPGKAQEVSQSIDGMTIDMGNSWAWFRPPGILDPAAPIVLSPMLSLIGPRFELIESEVSGQVVDDEGLLAISTASPYDIEMSETAASEDASMIEAAREVKALFNDWDKRHSEMTDDDAMEIAHLLKTFYDDRALAL